jgi:hypothetical protein
LFFETLKRKIYRDSFVFFRYRWSQYFTHPLFIRNYKKPPVVFASKNNAKLFHYYHSAEKGIGYNKPFVIEPIDHPISISYNGDATRLNDAVLETKLILKNGYCQHVILSSTGHKRLFEYYFGDLNLPTSVIYPACVPPRKLKKRHKPLGIIKFVSIISDFELKGLDLVIEAWLEADTSSSEWVIVCPNIPKKYIHLINSKNNIIHFKNVSERKKDRIYQSSDVALIPIHSDGLGVYIEAIEYELPIISFRTLHSYDFLSHGNGIEIDVPYNFYDVDKYGFLWNTIDEFKTYHRNSKSNDEFKQTKEQLVDKLNYININKYVFLNKKCPCSFRT